MEDEIVTIARAVAGRLAGEFGARLQGEIEAALHEAAPRPADQFVLDPVTLSLGSLIVTATGVAWTIYHDIKTDRRSPSRDHIERSLRLKVTVPPGVSANQRDAVIEVVVDEVFKDAGDA